MTNVNLSNVRIVSKIETKQYRCLKKEILMEVRKRAEAGARADIRDVISF